MGKHAGLPRTARRAIPTKTLRERCLWLVVCGFLFGIGALRAEDAPVSAELQAKIIAGCQAAFHDIASVRFAITTQTVFAADYLKQNPHRARFDHVIKVYEGTMAGERLRVSAAMTEADGHRIPDYLQTYDGEAIQLLRRSRPPVDDNQP